MKSGKYVIKFIAILLSLILFSCEQILTKDSTRKKPKLDSFFENIEEEKEEFIPPLLTNKALKIAVIAPLTGSYNKIGKEVLDTVNFVRAKVNNDNVSITIFDTGSSKDYIATIYSRIREEGYDVIVGPIFNYETVELIKQNDLKIPIISLSNDKSIVDENVLVFGNLQDDAISDAVTFFAQSDRKNFVSMFSSDASGSRFYKVFKGSAERNGANIMRVEFYDENGMSDISKYVSKIVNGLNQKIYISKTDGAAISERKIKDNLIKNPKLKLDTIYDLEERRANIFYISASGSTLDEIVKMLKKPENKSKLKDVAILLPSTIDTVDDFRMYNDMFFYANNYPGYKSYSIEFNLKNNYKPSKLSAILYDAISYTMYVNTNTYGNLTIFDLLSKSANFYGINGYFAFRGNTVRRLGKVMLVKDGVPRELSSQFNNPDVRKVKKELESINLKDL